MRFWMRRLSSGSVTSAQSASFAVALVTRLVLDDVVEAPGLLALEELAELILGLLGDMSDSLVSFSCFFSLESLDCLISLTMWLGRPEGFLMFCLRPSRRWILPFLTGDLWAVGKDLMDLMLPSEALRRPEGGM